MTQAIRIAVADDHIMFAEGLIFNLANQDGYEMAGRAENGLQLLDLLKTTSVDVILLDLSMPEMNGEEAALEILEKYPHIRILVITMHHTPGIILPLLDAGVHGFLIKNSSVSELNTAIREVYAGNRYMNREVKEIMEQREKIANPEKLLQITKREKEILQLIYEGMATNDIAEKLFISSYTVETHRRNLLSKTETKNATQLVNKAIQLGIIRIKPRL
jgi:DNA-binding NarL/FixJ family response regulator